MFDQNTQRHLQNVGVITKYSKGSPSCIAVKGAMLEF